MYIPTCVLVLIVIVIGQLSATTSPTDIIDVSLGRFTRQTSSKNNEFTCLNGECISLYNICDGEKSCSDGSDETTDLCQGIRCPVSSFRCSYGACIDNELKCDGKADCMDGSDEECGTKISSSQCGAKKYQCANSQCIDQYDTCDGTKHCSDGSDETRDLCGHLICPANSFQCSYGACLRRSVVCNGKSDCADHSDEPNDCESTPRDIIPDPTSQRCSLPEDMGNRLFCSHMCAQCSLSPFSSCTLSPGAQAVRIQCFPGYGLADGIDHKVSVCINQTWVPKLPECHQVCPPLESDFLDITCFNDFTEVDCRKPMLPGISATYKCKASHREFPNLSLVGMYRRTLFCRSDGKWTGYLPECEPICGVSRGNDTLTPSIVNGMATKLGQFPWHTALYKRNSLDRELWENICGGSLITHRVVLTAAHCVSGVITSPADLRVALGKYFRDWAKDEKDTVRRDVVGIKIPPEYKGGATSYTWDIALLLMNASVQFNSFVMPVCMNLNSHYHLTNGDNGYVVGWGKTAPGGVESEVLLYNNITIMAENDCQHSILLFLSFDKFCGIKSAVSVVQQGDSGGGLTAIVEGLHYIFGVVSTKSKEIPMFTNISWSSHRRWVNREIIDIENLF